MNKYDKAVRRLTTHPDEIFDAWNRPLQHPSGILFGFAGLGECGCLTQIRAGDRCAATPSLTARIRRDTRIPCHPDEITVASLPVFAAWQRKLDRYAFRRARS